MSAIGIIMLMGLVTKNAILLIDFAKQNYSKGMDLKEALIQAGYTRLRPIIMTSLAMIFGMLPTAMANGAGSELRAPMTFAIIGGLITTTLLTLLVVMVLYLSLLRYWIPFNPGVILFQPHSILLIQHLSSISLFYFLGYRRALKILFPVCLQNICLSFHQVRDLSPATPMLYPMY